MFRLRSRATRPGKRSSLALLLVLGALPLWGAGAAEGQAGAIVPAEVSVNDEAERYLRVLQLTGQSSTYPWSIRGFSLPEVYRILPPSEGHPWADRMPRSRNAVASASLLPARVRVVHNSGFPHGANEGALWAGRGGNVAASVGGAARLGPLSVVVRPEIFFAQNSSFQLAATGVEEGPLVYADPRNRRFIDAPQRFGDSSFVHVDPGQSTLRVDVLGVAAGISSANQHWGPAIRYPFILGTNAPGYPHAFLGTARPVPIGIGALHGRAVWGRLEASPYADLARPRFTSGAIVVYQPAFLDGLEIGGARFFHIPWREGGPIAEDILRPFEALLKDRRDAVTGGDGVITPSNQLASVFARWVFPGSGFELYGEFTRNDHNANFRDLAMEPDHASGYTLGFQRAWKEGEEAISVLRAEVVNAQISHLVRVREQSPIYVHTGLRQGHTHRGQILGSPAAYGGAGAEIAFDRYHQGGRWSVALGRELRRERSRRTDEPGMYDVLYRAGGTALLRYGRLDLDGGVEAVWNLNRDFDGSAFNLQTRLGVRLGL